MPRGNPQNLIQNQPDGAYSPEQLREWASKGGKASAEKRFHRKRLAEIFRELMVLDIGEAEIAAEMRARGVETDFANAVTYAVLQRALKGDIDAFKAVRDTIGEKPTESVNLGLNGPVKSMDLTKLTDAELEALADRENGL